jgi:hypothetical protein
MTSLRCLILLFALGACESAEAPTPPRDDEDGELELDAGKRDASTRDAARDARVLDARVPEQEPEPEPAEEDASAPPAVVDAAVDARAPTNATLPAVTDLAKPGPFTPTRAAGPAGYVLFHPQELGKDGVKHPIVTWGPGAAENAGSFTTLLNHFASHGFVVISYDGTPNGAELTKGIDWLVAEDARAGSMFNGKLDTTKVASGGHSAGSLATFRIAKDARLTTTMHLCGGTFDPHTDIDNLHAPALFICGEAGGDGLLVGDVARANCDIDFKNAKVPVFYGIPKGASHMSPTEIGDAALRSKFAAACVGWLRWQLAGDLAQKQVFVGADCTLCKDASWTAQQKNLN